MTPPASASAAPRLPGLDLLRAVAIVWVMLTHGGMFGLIGDDNWFASDGWMGVDLFFALSGYLIAGQLLRPWGRSERPDYGRFFVRRLLRTLPAYLAVIGVYFLIPPLRDQARIEPLWRFLSFTLNIGPNPAGTSFSHAWSLCVEEQFYLVLPLTVALLARRPTAARIAGLVAGVVVLGWRCAAISGSPMSPGGRSTSAPIPTAAPTCS
jgi:peptidoglycan/LPS O-acetylase OafA/YrhL